jgi:hypothetical protein
MTSAALAGSALERFRAGAAPVDAVIDGVWAVRAWLGPLPEFRAFGHCKEFRREGGRIVGNNRFLGGLRLGYFYLDHGISALGDGLDVIKIVYDVPRNPPPMRWLTDEVRFVADDELLGRGVMQIPGLQQPRQVFWFTVRRT